VAEREHRGGVGEDMAGPGGVWGRVERGGGPAGGVGGGWGERREGGGGWWVRG